MSIRQASGDKKRVKYFSFFVRETRHTETLRYISSDFSIQNESSETREFHINSGNVSEKVKLKISIDTLYLICLTSTMLLNY